MTGMENFLLRQGDCLQILKQIDNNSVDMVLCDLPYGVLNKTNAKWDVPIDLAELWRQYIRVCKENAAIVLFGQGIFTANLIKSNEKMWRYNLVWDKQKATGFLNANRMPLRYHEDILVFYNRQPTYNPQMEDLNGREVNHKRGNGKHSVKNQCYGEYEETKDRDYGDKKFPSSIIRIKALPSANRHHPTEKPLALIEYLIRTFTNRGDVVLDNCMGSGTTGVAALNTGRNFIGIELSQSYFNVAEHRIKEAISGA